MALLTLPEGQQRSGKQGGIVFSRNAYGPYVRERAIPTNPNTTQQIAVRAAFTVLMHRFFQTLTDVQRQQWESYANAVKYVNRLGAQVVLKASSMYIACNTLRLQAGLDPVDPGPITLQKADLPLDGVAGVILATQKVTLAYDNTDDWAKEDGGAVVVFQGQPINPWRWYIKGPTRFVGKVLGNKTTPPTSPLSVDAAFPFQEGHKVPIYFRCLRADGRISDPFWAGPLAAT